MCEKSRQGSFGGPAEFVNLTTGIEQCQRSGTFINSTSAALKVRTEGMTFSIPAGKSGTVPVGPDVQLHASGKGAVAWALTSAVLPAQINDAPSIGAQDDPTPAESAEVKLHTNNGTVKLTLDTGTYSKFVIMQAGADQGDI